MPDTPAETTDYTVGAVAASSVLDAHCVRNSGEGYASPTPTANDEFAIPEGQVSTLALETSLEKEEIAVATTGRLRLCVLVPVYHGDGRQLLKRASRRRHMHQAT